MGTSYDLYYPWVYYLFASQMGISSHCIKYFIICIIVSSMGISSHSIIHRYIISLYHPWVYLYHLICIIHGCIISLYHPCLYHLKCIIHGYIISLWVYHLIVSSRGISFHCIIHGFIISFVSFMGITHLLICVCHLWVFHLLALSSCCIIMGISFDHFIFSYGVSSPYNDSGALL